ncbi:zinc finger MYM-type protein 1-like protein, partial [Tanacetum coccineum]
PLVKDFLMLHKLESLDLNIDDVCGQGYDNGSNMKALVAKLWNFLELCSVFTLFLPILLRDVAIKEVEGLILFFEKFRDMGFDKARNLAKEIAIEMDIDP